MQAYFFMRLCFSLYLIEFFKAWFYSWALQKEFPFVSVRCLRQLPTQEPFNWIFRPEVLCGCTGDKNSSPKLTGEQSDVDGTPPRAYFLFVFYSFQGQGHDQYVFSTSFPLGHLCFSSLAEGVTFMQCHLCVEAIRLYSYLAAVLGLYLSKFLDLVPFLS